ncbi:hypothetical protein [Sporisorium scitamineum]|uniref:Uncharacterized protein n=1 Tax=Sporisorium scitamineum TaxID=49012 RepID=A0A0F7S3P3_9BASI|nr:hypothetical protein [Sporisorium scitamineum]
MSLTSEKTSNSYDERAALLFAAWFSTLADRLQERNLPVDKFAYLVQLNDFGDSEHESERLAFFQAVNETARESTILGVSDDSEPDAVFKHHLDAPLQRLSNQISLMQQRTASTASQAEPMVPPTRTSASTLC